MRIFLFRGRVRVGLTTDHRIGSLILLGFGLSSELVGLMKGDEQCKYMVDSDSDMSGDSPSCRRSADPSEFSANAEALMFCVCVFLLTHQAISINCMQLV